MNGIDVVSHANSVVTEILQLTQINNVLYEALVKISESNLDPQESKTVASQAIKDATKIG